MKLVRPERVLLLLSHQNLLAVYSVHTSVAQHHQNLVAVYLVHTSVAQHHQNLLAVYLVHTSACASCHGHCVCA
jgi:hypothetical protein